MGIFATESRRTGRGEERMNDEAMKGIVFNIQKFSVHDGEGIRTLVFLKGCPLRCKWCSNPESQEAKPQHAYNPARCLTAELCGRCLEACKTGALTLVNGMIAFDGRKCENCFACNRACPSGAQQVYGEEMSVKDILDRVERDGVFYSRSSGGMTLSGGEALFQHDFALALLRAAKNRHIGTTIETCGFYKYEFLQEACRNLDRLIIDIKSLNNEKHKAFTGVDNTIILENFKRVVAEFPDLKIQARTPVIPGFNDTEEDIRAIRDFVPQRANVEYELLPFHRMGGPKYGYLCRRYEYADKELDKNLLKRLKAIAADVPAFKPGGTIQA